MGKQIQLFHLLHKHVDTSVAILILSPVCGCSLVSPRVKQDTQ